MLGGCREVSMREYIIRRVLMNIPVIWLVSLMVFSLIRLVPGDVVMMLIGESAIVAKEDMDELRHQLGLDKPYGVAYVEWIGGVVRGDLGKSLYHGRDVMKEILQKIPISAELAVLAILLALFIAIPMGVITAARQDTPIDYGARSFVILGLSLPDFWLGTMAVVFPAIWWHVAPPLSYQRLWVDPLANLQQMLVPAAILGVHLSASTMRLTRSQMLEVLRQDYIRTAWAKGLRERVVIYRHALKNAMIPVITIFGTQLSRLLGGTLIMEILFNLPGMGRFMYEGILQRDYPVVQGGVLFIAFVMVSMNLIVDITYAWFDPRIRYR